MGNIGVVLAGIALVNSPALAQTAQYNLPHQDAVRFQESGSKNVALPFADSNQGRRLSETLPGAWQDDRQVLSAVQTAGALNGGDDKDGMTLYATSRRTIVSWKPGGGLDDASVSRTALTPGQASVGLAYRTGQTTVALAYVNREYSQRIGAQSVSQTENFAGVTLKLELGGK